MLSKHWEIITENTDSIPLSEECFIGRRPLLLGGGFALPERANALQREEYWGNSLW